MKLSDACNVIKAIYGFDDETSSAGEAWGIVQDGVERLEAENTQLRTVLSSIIEQYDGFPEEVLVEIAPSWLGDARALLT